jgi:hypothetical protein
MWTCPECGRIFKNTNQPHSCQRVPLEKHFDGRDLAKGLFDDLLEQMRAGIGACQVISIPCCVHIFGSYDFVAALPKKDRLEVRFALNRTLDNPRIHHSVPMSATIFKNCLDLRVPAEIDAELLGWLRESYHLKD